MHSSPAEVDALRDALLERARELGLLPDAVTPSDEEIDGLLDVLLSRDGHIPTPTTEECRRYYDANPSRFTAGEIVEASHILIAVTKGGDIDALRRQAEVLLDKVRAQPERFAEIASGFSNCPSGAEGGSLGQIQRGETVPEFEQALFGAAATGVLPRLVNTRHGFHVVCVARRVPGCRVAYDAVRPAIVRHLRERARAHAAAAYVRHLKKMGSDQHFGPAP